jgi:hypothetical protein
MAWRKPLEWKKHAIVTLWHRSGVAAKEKEIEFSRLKWLWQTPFGWPDNDN